MGKDISLLDIFTDDVEVDLKRVKPWQRCELFIVILKVEMRRVLTVYFCKVHNLFYPEIIKVES